MGRSQLSEMRGLEKENARLKKIVAELELDKMLLRRHGLGSPSNSALGMPTLVLSRTRSLTDGFFDPASPLPAACRNTHLALAISTAVPKTRVRSNKTRSTWLAVKRRCSTHRISVFTSCSMSVFGMHTRQTSACSERPVCAQVSNAALELKVGFGL